MPSTAAPSSAEAGSSPPSDNGGGGGGGGGGGDSQPLGLILGVLAAVVALGAAWAVSRGRRQAKRVFTDDVGAFKSADRRRKMSSDMGGGSATTSTNPLASASVPVTILAMTPSGGAVQMTDLSTGQRSSSDMGDPFGSDSGEFPDPQMVRGSPSQRLGLSMFGRASSYISQRNPFAAGARRARGRGRGASGAGGGGLAATANEPATSTLASPTARMAAL